MQKTLTVAIVLTIASTVGVLGFFFITDSEGYSFAYCNTFPLPHHAHAHGVESESPDEQRIHDLHKITYLLENYRVVNGSYPISTELAPVRDILQENIPADPCEVKNSNYTYQYRSSEDGESFVIKTLLSDSTYRYVHMQYSESVTGDVLGVWCGDGIHRREFCLSSM